MNENASEERILRLVHVILVNAWLRAKYYRRKSGSITVKRVAGEAGIGVEEAYAAIMRVMSEDFTITYIISSLVVRSPVWRLLRWEDAEVNGICQPRRIWFRPWNEAVEGLLAHAGVETA